MIAKTTISANIKASLDYGADIKNGTKSAKLLASSNLISNTPDGMAEEMTAVADTTRCKRALWHTSISWQPGETVTPGQMLKAAQAYCKGIGADPKNHQIAIYKHEDKKHPHVHIYINRASLDGGPALDTSFNFAQNTKLMKLISNQLGFEPIPERRTSLKSPAASIQNARTSAKEAIEFCLNSLPTNTTELSAELKKQGIESTFKEDSKGNLVGCSFKIGDIALKGSEVGYKAKQVATALEESHQNKSLWADFLTGFNALKEQERMKKEIIPEKKEENAPKIKYKGPSL
jgi:hypothetical protein